jgi:site-specific recombinase XerD
VKGVDIMTVKELLGHSSLEMTQRYAHLTDRYKAEAVARLNNLVTIAKQDEAQEFEKVVSSLK